MIFTNLAGTTSKRFSVSNDGKGQIVSNNAYDIWWNMVNGASGEKNHSVIFLNNGDDLNNAFTPAQYFKSNAEITVANNPATSAFIMVVEPSSGDNAPGYVVQKIFTVYGEFFIRTRIDNTWQTWKKFAYTSDIPTVPTLHAVATSGDYNSLANKPTLHSVASTGDYNSLINKPNAPSPFDASWTPTVWSGTVTNSKCYCYRHDKLLFLSGEFEVQRSNSAISLDIEGMPFNINPVAPCVGNGTVEYTGTLYENVSKVIQIYPYVRQQSLSFYAQLNGDGRLSVYDIGPLLETNGPIYVTFSVTCFAFS